MHPWGEPQLVPGCCKPGSPSPPSAPFQSGEVRNAGGPLSPNSDLCVSEQELGREHGGKIVNTVPGFLGKKEIGKRDYELALK
uniref:Macaca fascicularis brain cDNA, clone: QbsB-10383 n=1 Tax=Macaca fascicularis TaxID=9541 RepID=I7GHY6_MACFA|nr:unnamed protein product [Macaca fascicularis]